MMRVSSFCHFSRYRSEPGSFRLRSRNLVSSLDVWPSMAFGYLGKKREPGVVLPTNVYKGVPPMLNADKGVPAVKRYGRFWAASC
jgi:hypothetical protein